MMTPLVLSLALHGAPALEAQPVAPDRPGAPATAAAAPASAKPSDAVDQARLLETIRALPTKRSGSKDPEHRAGLKATEALLLARLREMGYTATLHEIGAFNGRGEAPNESPPAPEGPKPPPATPAPAVPRSQPGPVPPGTPASAIPVPGAPAKKADAPVGDGEASPVWHNIIVDIPGVEKPAEVILVGAHFDAVPPSPGADDNGTGTAALLEIARVLKDQPMSRTVRLAFFNLEEVQPYGVALIGSTAYASDLSPKIADGSIKVVGMVCMDTIGYYSEEPNSQTWPKLPIKIELPTTADFILVGGLVQYQSFSQPLIKAMREASPEINVLAGDILPIAVPNFLRSDHAPFISMGIPSVFITDTANFRSPNYHKPTDTVDTLDPRRFTMTVRAVAGGVWHLAGPISDSSARPRRPQSEPRPEPAPVDPHPATPSRSPSSPPGLGPVPGQGPERPR